MGKNKLVVATITAATALLGEVLVSQLTQERGWGIIVGLVAGAIGLTYLSLRWQDQSQEEGPEGSKERVRQLEAALRSQVQSRSYGARSRLIEAPLKELDLDITPRVGLVRDPSLTDPEPISDETTDDIVVAFESSKRRLLIVGEPGSGKSMTAYSLIEYLDKIKGGARRIPLLVNVSAWEAQDNFEAFLVDYLCSSVGYQVRQRAVARAFIESRRYNLILDGLDEIPAGLRAHFSERLDDFVRGLSSEVGVVVTCRIQEYEELLAANPTGLGLVQAVQILPLTDEQLDRAFVELTKRDEDWEPFLSQRHLKAYQRVRNLLSNPLFLNLAAVGHLSPGELLDFTTTRQELRGLVLEKYLDRTLAEQSQYDPVAARHYLSWIARFLNGSEVSPFGLKTPDSTVFDLSSLTPPDPPWVYRFFCVLFGFGFLWPAFEPVSLLSLVVLYVSMISMGLGLTSGWPFKGSAVSSPSIVVLPSSRQKLFDFLRRAVRGLVMGLVVGLFVGLAFGLAFGLGLGMSFRLVEMLSIGTSGLILGLPFGLAFGLGSGLLQTRPVLLSSRSPKEAQSRSLFVALAWLGLGVTLGVVFGLVSVLLLSLAFDAFYPSDLVFGLVFGPILGLVFGLVFGMRNGGWFVLLQKVAHRLLCRTGKLPRRPYDLIEWGIERQIFRRVGGGVRFRHSLIQQHLANIPEDGALRSSEASVAAPQSDGSGTPLR